MVNSSKKKSKLKWKKKSLMTKGNSVGFDHISHSLSLSPI